MDDVDGFMGRHGLAYRNVVIDEWDGTTGVGVFEVARRRRISPVLADRAAAEDWVREHALLVLSAAAHGIDVPSPDLVRRYAGSIRRTLRNLEHAREDIGKSLASWEGYLAADEAAGKDVAGLRDTVGRKRRQLAEVDGHEAGLRALAARVAADPAGAFLPVGATVRVRQPPTRPYALEGYHMHRPEVGSTGVVIGLPDASAEWGVLVAFEDYVDVSGERWKGRLDPPVKFNFDAADLEVLALGRVLGRGEIRGVEFAPSHAHADDAGNREMVVEGRGRVWRIWQFDHAGEPWHDAVGRKDAASLDFLVPLAGTPREEPAEAAPFAP